MERRIKNKGNFKGGGRSLKPKLKEALQIKANVKEQLVKDRARYRMLPMIVLIDHV